MSNFRSSRRLHLAIGLLLAAPAIAVAQQPAPGSAATAPDTGQMAPDFTLPGATRFGLLKEPIKLSNFRGQTVVLAFFPKARTKG
jgi:peroxiredoxin Q/BCP